MPSNAAPMPAAPRAELRRRVDPHPFAPADQAEGYRQLIEEAGLTQEELGRRLGRSIARSALDGSGRLTRFASAEGKKGGQFYTPQCVVRVLVAQAGVLLCRLVGAELRADLLKWEAEVELAEQDFQRVVRAHARPVRPVRVHAEVLEDLEPSRAGLYVTLELCGRVRAPLRVVET